MKKKNEENLPEKGCGTKMPAENVTTNEVVENEIIKEGEAEEQQEEAAEYIVYNMHRIKEKAASK